MSAHRSACLLAVLRIVLWSKLRLGKAICSEPRAPKQMLFFMSGVNGWYHVGCYVNVIVITRANDRMSVNRFQTIFD